jgi:soluble lytic murein transglycosylase
MGTNRRAVAHRWKRALRGGGLAVGVAFLATAVPTRGEENAGAAPADPAAGAARSLRGAMELVSRGEVEAGAAALERISNQHEIVSDVAALLAARGFVGAGRFNEALGALARFQSRGVTTPFATALERLRGEAAVGAGDPAAAHRAFSHALLGTEDPAEMAPILRSLAELEEAAGQKEDAAGRWLRLWRDLPAQPAARGSGEKLAALEATMGRTLRSADDARTRGDRLFEAGLREASLDAYASALAAGLDGEDRRAALRRRGEALFGLRRYGEAASTFAELAGDPEAEVFEARSLARSGDVEAAVSLLLSRAEQRPAGVGAGARWYAALLLEGEGENERARSLFASVAAEASDPSLRANARWRLGFAAYRARRFDVARRELEAMAAVATEPIAKLQARYWAARAGERADLETSLVEMQAIASEAPFTYYGWRASEWLARRRSVSKASLAAPIPPGEARLAERDLLRARILVLADLDDLAASELARLATQVGGYADVVRVATLHREAGRYDRAQQLVQKRFGDVLPRGPAPGQEALWQAAWPRAHADAVERATKGLARLRPPLVFALMREESSFRPAVRSSAGAIGLMQLMPATAQKVARDVGLQGFDVERLTDPATNIRLGTAYLDGLLGRFDGRASAAIGGYNAGPEAVARWLAERGDLADDEWVETIPYEETRNYVKRVERSLHVYRSLHGR